MADEDDHLTLMPMFISLAFALRHKHNISTRTTNHIRSSCAYAYAYVYALVKTSLIRAGNWPYVLHLYISLFVCLFLLRYCIFIDLFVSLFRYEIMCQSWMHSPEDRPSFTDVVARLDKLLDDKTTEVMCNSKFLILFKMKTSNVFS